MPPGHAAHLVLAQSVDVDPAGSLAEGAESALRGFLLQVPQILLAVVVLVVFVLLAKVVAAVVRKALSTTTDRSDSFLNVMSRLARAATVFFGIMLALVVAVPTINLATLVGGLGISTVAIGFAFKDILQNTLAGLLLLFRQPFAIGDQIEVVGYTGTVQEINIRETRLKTFDGQRILIPNADVYSSSVRIQTANPTKRVAIVVGVDYEADLDLAQQVAVDAVSAVEGVHQDPPVEALYTDMGASTVNIDVRYWASSTQLEARRVQDRVVRALTRALNDAGIDMPADITEIDVRASFVDAVREARGARTSDSVSS